MRLNLPLIAVACAVVCLAPPSSAQSDPQRAPAYNSGSYYPPQPAPARFPGTASYPAQTGYRLPPSAAGVAGQTSTYFGTGGVPNTEMALAGNSGAAMSVGQWFTAYDNIRHQAQMTPAERQQADALMSRGLSMFMPGEEKLAAKALLQQMVGRYQRACQQLKALPILSQTQLLHRSYYNYFSTAGQLFADYVRVQDNLFVADASGQPLASSLLQRKQNLETVEHQCKQLDAQMRQQFGVPPYPW